MQQHLDLEKVVDVGADRLIAQSPWTSSKIRCTEGIVGGSIIFPNTVAGILVVSASAGVPVVVAAVSVVGVASIRGVAD